MSAFHWAVRALHIQGGLSANWTLKVDAHQRRANFLFARQYSSCSGLSSSMEEEWMRSQFGETYATYAHQTAALVPYLF